MIKTDIPAAIISTGSSELISAMFRGFETEEICYCVLRNYENLPEDYGNDLDILIRSADFSTGLKIILRTAAELNWSIAAETKPLGIRRLYLGSTDVNQQVLIIDVFKNIFWKGIPANSTGAVLDSRRRFKNFWIVSAGSDGAVTLVKELLMFGSIKKRNNAMNHIKSCANSDADAFLACLEPCFGSTWAKWLLSQSQSGYWQAIEIQYRSLRWSIAWRGFLRNPVLQIYRWISFLNCHIRHRLAHPLGFFIVLLGPDGSGKTTLCKELVEFWKSNFSRQSVHIHGNFKILPNLKVMRQLWSKITGKPLKPDIDFTKRHSGVSVKPHPLILSLCYLSYYIWDYILGHLLVFHHKGKDRLIVADRYFYDYFFQLRNVRLPHRLLHIFRRLVPKPDLIVYLERSPEEIYKVKDELTVNEIKRQQAIIGKLIQKLPDAICINGDSGVQKSCRQIRHHILEKLTKRNN
jgi:thymidylate kinase